MEARKILFILNNSSSQKTIMSSAETLAQLKTEMRDASIDYSNMTFYEGRTRTELKDDNSILPTNIPVPAKGTTPASTTNELVFMLTTQNKKIRSGALSSERTSVMDTIRAQNLQSAVLKEFGRNMTQIKTTDLQAFLNKVSTIQPTPKPAQNTPSATEVVAQSTEAVVTATIAESVPAAPVVNDRWLTALAYIVVRLLEILEDDYAKDFGELLEEARGLVNNTTSGPEEPQVSAKPQEEKLSQAELNAMFGGWCK